MRSFIKKLRQAALMTLVLLVICGVAYPLALTGVSQVIFPKQANGSIIEENGKAVGSSLVGQQFTDDRFFKGRISSVSYNTYTEADLEPDAEGNTAYGGVSSGSFNYAASNPALKERVELGIEEFLAKNPDVKKEDIPADLMTASGSGLDPHISPKAAEIQIPAIAKATGLSEEALAEIVKNNTSNKVFGVLGEVRVNVLEANIEIAKQTGIL